MKDKQLRLRVTQETKTLIKLAAQARGITVTSMLLQPYMGTHDEKLDTQKGTQPQVATQKRVSKSETDTQPASKLVRTEIFSDGKGTTIDVESRTPIVDKDASIGTISKLLNKQLKDTGVLTTIKGNPECVTKPRIEPIEIKSSESASMVTTTIKPGRPPTWVAKAERKLKDTTKKELKDIATASFKAEPAKIETLLKAANQPTSRPAPPAQPKSKRASCALNA